MLADAARHRCLRRRRAPSSGFRRVGARGRARGNRRAHSADPARLGGDGALIRRSHSRLRALRHGRCRFERTRRGDAGARLVHRVVSVVRIRSRAIRGAVRGEARSVRCAAQAGAGDLAGQDAAAARQPAGFPAAGKAAAQNLDRRRRQPGIRCPRRALRPAVNAGHHRRRSAAVHALH